MLLRNLILPTLLAPVVAASTALVALRGQAADRLQGVAPAAAFLGGFVALTGWPRWLPAEATQRLFYVVAVAGAAAWLAAPERRRAVAWAARGVATAALLGWLLQAPLQHRWTVVQAAAWLGCLFVAGLALHAAWATSLRAEGDRSQRVSPLVRLALLVGLAGVLGMSGSARLAQLAGALAAGAAAVEAGSRLLRRRPWQGGEALVVATAVMGLMVIGLFYADLGPWAAALLLASFLALGLPAGGRPWLRLLALAPLAGALGLAAWGMLGQPEDPYGDDLARLPTGAEAAPLAGEGRRPSSWNRNFRLRPSASPRSATDPAGRSVPGTGHAPPDPPPSGAAVAGAPERLGDRPLDLAFFPRQP